MKNFEERAIDLGMKGLCCSQIVLILAGLEPQGKTNDELLNAAKGLARGMYIQHACGSLSGGACVFGLYDMSKEEIAASCKELTQWFKERFGSLECSGILGVGGMPTPVCTETMAETSQKCLEILEEKRKLRKGTGHASDILNGMMSDFDEPCCCSGSTSCC